MSAVLIFAVFNLTMHFYLKKLQAEYDIEAKKVRKEAAIFITKARNALPDKNSVNLLRKKIEQYNLNIAGPRTVWTRFFNQLEKILPTDSVIVSIKESTSQKPVFAAEDRNFLMTIVVDSMEIANSIYREMASANTFRSLSFTPIGAKEYQGRSGIGVEISFQFKPKI